MGNRCGLKALAMVTAYEKVTTALPSFNAVILICAVAEHETQCGDAWGNSGNWGAVMRRVVTQDEKTTIANGGKPSPRDPFEILKGDSDPVTGHYAVWFWQFPAGITYPPVGLAGDEAGAYKLIQTLFSDRPGKPSVQAIIDTATEDELAGAMYARGYFAGFHDPRQPGGKEANIADYATALKRASKMFRDALGDWKPGETIPDTTVYSGTVVELQQILNAWSGGALVRLTEDGVMGPQTTTTLKAFQNAHGLTVDGIPGPETWAALKDFANNH